VTLFVPAIRHAVLTRKSVLWLVQPRPDPLTFLDVNDLCLWRRTDLTERARCTPFDSSRMAGTLFKAPATCGSPGSRAGAPPGLDPHHFVTRRATA